VKLLADAELRDDFAVAVRIALFEVVEEAAALADQHQKTAAGAVVLLVGLEVLCQLANALAEERNLDLGASGVRVVRTKLVNDVCLLYRFQHSSCCS
jgi:hypothetical protein